MDGNTIFLIVVISAAVAGVFFAVGYVTRKRFAERLIRTAEGKARDILTTAKRESEEVLKRTDRESRQSITKAQSEFEDQIAQRKRDLDNLEKVQRHREETVANRLDTAEKREREALYKLQQAELKAKDIADLENSLNRMIGEEREVLQKISKLDPAEAKTQLLSRMEIEIRRDASKLIETIEHEAKETAEKKAQWFVSLAIMRNAAAYTTESSVTVVPLPSEDMKGRIIGKDGRNIKTFETQTGVDLVIDETPGVVTLSSFDGVRREVAKIALEELIQDGRIQPARIEEVVQKTKRNMESVLKEIGEKALQETNLTGMHPELIKLLGRLKYRTSYGQNVLNHSIECAHMMSAIAFEMGLDPILARRAGLLHDIGKAVSAEVEGPHALIGGEFCRRYGEHPDVVHGVEAHHEDIEMKSVWPMLVQGTDSVSAARPGARRESLENYLKRVKSLEDIADKHPGVDKSYVIQGGREVRVVVKPDRVPEDCMSALAREISKKIEDNLDYPGQIKVVVIRESRTEDFAK
jgi:ribonucrease Y